MIKEFWKKLTGKKDGSQAPAPADGAGESANALEQFGQFKGDRKQLFKMLRNPKVRQQIMALYQRMQADGVDVRNEEQIKKWVMDHKEELEKGAPAAGTQPTVKTTPIVHEGPQVGRNDPCHCGSGKKFKKCHAT